MHCSRWRKTSRSPAHRAQVPLKTPKTLPLATVRRILDAAEGRTRLYLALALLCGMTQRDMADLRHNEIDLKTDRLTRKRSKTQRHEGVPTVSYPLPKPVVKLLKAEMTDGSDDAPALLTAKGYPLVHGRCNDSVRLAFGRLLDHINDKAREKAEERKTKGEKNVKPDTVAASIKLMRSTSATKLEHDKRFKSVAVVRSGPSIL